MPGCWCFIMTILAFGEGCSLFLHQIMRACGREKGHWFHSCWRYPHCTCYFVIGMWFGRWMLLYYSWASESRRRKWDMFCIVGLFIWTCMSWHVFCFLKFFFFIYFFQDITPAKKVKLFLLHAYLFPWIHIVYFPIYFSVFSASQEWWSGLEIWGLWFHGDTL